MQPHKDNARLTRQAVTILSQLHDDQLGTLKSTRRIQPVIDLLTNELDWPEDISHGQVQYIAADAFQVVLQRREEAKERQSRTSTTGAIRASQGHKNRGATNG